jgi:hypothetical protein
LSSASASGTQNRPANWTYQRPKLAKYQLDALFCLERYSVVEATTKAGKTVGCMAWLLEQAIKGSDGQNFWWVAPIFSQAKIPFRRMKRGLPLSVYTANETELTITLANGAILCFKGADKPDSLYGEDVYAAVIDEDTRCKEEAFVAVRSTLTATRGPLRLIGNVKGRKNWAYVLARKAEAGEPGWHYAKITALDAVAAGILAAEEIEDARRTLPKHVFDQLYMAEPSDDGGNPFGIKAIADAIAELHTDCEPRWWGWDLARSNDWTVGVGLCEHAKTCCFERWNQSDLPQTVVDNPEPGEANRAYWTVTIRRVRDLTQHVSALVDSTGPGGPIDLALSADGMGNIEGYVFSQRSKQQLMEGLAVAIQRKEVGYPDNEIRDELDTFEYEYTRTGVKYSAPPGLHDDCVCALALAKRCRELNPGGSLLLWGGDDD